MERHNLDESIINETSFSGASKIGNYTGETLRPTRSNVSNSSGSSSTPTLVGSARSSVVSLAYTLCGDSFGDYLVHHKLRQLTAQAECFTRNVVAWPEESPLVSGRAAAAGRFWEIYAEIGILSCLLKGEKWSQRALEIRLHLLRTKEAQSCDGLAKLHILCRIYDTLQAEFGRKTSSSKFQVETTESIRSFITHIFKEISSYLPGYDAVIVEELIKKYNVVEYLFREIAAENYDYSAQNALVSCIATPTGRAELERLEHCEGDLLLAALQRLVGLQNHFVRQRIFLIFGDFAQPRNVALHPERQRYYEVLVGSSCLGALAQPWSVPAYLYPKLFPHEAFKLAESRVPGIKSHRLFHREMEVACAALLIACRAGFHEEVCKSDVPRLLVGEIRLRSSRDDYIAATLEDEEHDDPDAERDCDILFNLILTLLKVDAGRKSLVSYGIRDALRQFSNHRNRRWLELSASVCLRLSLKLLDFDQ